MVDFFCKVLYYHTKPLSAAKNQERRENVSSKNFEELKTLFESLPADERKAFTAIIKESVKANSFNLGDLVNSKENDGIICPHCRHIEPKGIVWFGIRRGIQWYKCKACDKTFSSVTGTLWSHTKKDFYTWKTFLKCMMDGRSIRNSADICKISVRTAFIWRHKILDALAVYQNNQRRMKGIVEADDTFFPISYKGSEPIGRKAHRRGTPADLRGTSKRKVVVSCAVSRNGQVFSRVSALGRPTVKALENVFRKRISKTAVVCTDNDRAYVRYGKNSPFTHIRVPNGIVRRGKYHSQNVNAYHSQLKRFLRKFNGVSTKYLNNYLVWNNIIQLGNRTRIALLKLCVKALTFSLWFDISDRPAIPV